MEIILGPIAEVQLRRGLILVSQGDASVIFNPLTLLLVALNIFSILNPYIPEIKAKIKKIRAN